MTGTSNPETFVAAPPVKPLAKAISRKWLFIVLVLAFLFVLMPYLLWQATWFGRPLNDSQMAAAFNDAVHPREAQHALSQVADRIMSNDAAVRESAKKWYPQVVDLSSSPDYSLRLTAAWVMGQDATVPEFHAALKRMLSDKDPMVCRNAALSLVRYGDVTGHDVIVSMLKPSVLVSPAAGKLTERLSQGDTVNVGTMVGKVSVKGSVTEIRTKIPGTLIQWMIADGSDVTEGQQLARLDPNSEMVYESLRALFLIGNADDISSITPFVRGIPGMQRNVAKQAQLTLDAIHSKQNNSIPAK